MRPNTHTRTLLYCKRILKWNNIQRVYLCIICFNPVKNEMTTLYGGFKLTLRTELWKPVGLIGAYHHIMKIVHTDVRFVQHTEYSVFPPPRKGSRRVLYGEAISVRCSNYRKHINYCVDKIRIFYC